MSVPSSNAPRRKLKSKFAVWSLVSWNVRSLLKIRSSIETARQGSEPDNAEDRKVDRFISEFRRYDIEVGGLQETKWFGSNVYRVGGSVVLTSGRKIPIGDAVKQ